MELVLISGLSGSGKSVALNLLEDAGYYCVDNLPVIMLTVLVRMLKEENTFKVAVAIDARSGHGIELLPEKLKKLADEDVRQTFLFLHANEETLLKRYSESRRRHPLATTDQTRAEAIACMRRALGEFIVEGIQTTIPIHREIFNHSAFIDGQVDTTFIERHWMQGKG